MAKFIPMIKTEKQYKDTKELVELFGKALKQIGEAPADPAVAAEKAALAAAHKDLLEDVRNYELRTGMAARPPGNCC